MLDRFQWKRHFSIAVATFVLFWVGDALMDALIFNYGEGSVMEALITAEPRELWMRTFSSSLLALFFIGGNILTERKRAVESALRQSDELSAFFLDYTNDAICIFSIGSNGPVITGVNSVFLNKYALSRKDIVGRRLNALVAGGKLPEVILSQVTDCAATGATITREVCSVCSRQRYYDEVITHAIRSSGESVERVLQVIRDITVRRTAEALLRESEARYRAIFENTGTAMAIIHPDGTLHMVNRGFEAITGYKRQELEGSRNWTDFVSPGDRERMIATLHAAQSPLQRSFELQMVSRAGDTMEMAGNWAAISGSDEAVLSLVDITVRKEVEEALRDSQTVLAIAQRIARLGNWVWDVTTDTLTWSEELCRIYEVDPATFTPTYEWFLQRLHPEDREMVVKSINEALYDHKPYNLDFRVVLDGGVVRTMSVRGEVSYDEKGNPLRMVGTNQDITWRRESEQALRASEEKFSKAFRASPDSIVITRAQDGMYIDVNEAFEQITGYGRDEVIGKTSLQLKLWAEPEARMVMLRLLNQYGHVRNLEVKFRVKSGEVREMLWSAEVIEYCGEACLIAISRDVTDQRHLEKELLESDARLYMKHEELKNLFHQMEAIRREWEETMDCISDMFILTDQWGKIRRFNRAVETFTGMAHRDIVGRDWLPFLEDHGLKSHLASPGEELVHQATGKRLVLNRYAFPTTEVDGSSREVVIINDTTGIRLRRPAGSLRLASPRREAN